MDEAVDGVGAGPRCRLTVQGGSRLARLFVGPAKGMEACVVIALAVDADVNVFAGDGDRGVA